MECDRRGSLETLRENYLQAKNSIVKFTTNFLIAGLP
jgi:hypothetical protein